MRKTTNPELNTIKKANVIYRLRLQGKTYKEIAAEIHYDKSNACNLVGWLKENPQFIEKGGEKHE